MCGGRSSILHYGPLTETNYTHAPTPNGQSPSVSLKKQYPPHCIKNYYHIGQLHRMNLGRLTGSHNLTLSLLKECQVELLTTTNIVRFKLTEYQYFVFHILSLQKATDRSLTPNMCFFHHYLLLEAKLGLRKIHPWGERYAGANHLNKWRLTDQGAIKLDLCLGNTSIPHYSIRF